MRDENEREQAKGKSRKDVLSDLKERKRSADDAAAKSAAENADELGELEQLAGQADIRERARQVQFVNAGIGNRALVRALSVPKTPGGPVDWDMWRNMPTAIAYGTLNLAA